MDEVDSVLMPKPRQRRPKDSFQSELQAKLYHRRSQGLTTEITDSEEESHMNYTKDYQSSYSNRPGSAKRRSDRSPDLAHGLGTTTMRSRDLTQLLHQSTGHLDDDDDDEEVMAANMGRTNAMGSWKTAGLKTPSPKQDPRYQRKTPTRESPKDSSHLDSIYGRRTPTRESPKEQGKLNSLYGKKNPTRDASPKALTKEDIIFGRKTPTSSGDGHRLPGMDGRDKPWQPPSFRSVSPNSPTEHSRGSRGVTPTDSGLEPIDERMSDKVTPRLQRGERLRGDDSPRQLSLGERPIPQSRTKTGDRKSPMADRKSPYADRKSPHMDSKSPYADRKSSYMDSKSPYTDRKSSYMDRKSPYTDRKSPLIDSSPSKESPSGMKRAPPVYDLFGKSRSTASQEVEDFIQSEKKTDPRYGRALTKSPDGRKTPTDGRKTLTNGISKYQGQGEEKGKRGEKTTGQRELGRKTPTGKKTPTDYKRNFDKKTTADKRDDLNNRKSPVSKGSSLLDFLTEDTEKPKAKKTVGKGRQLDDEIDDMFGSNQRYLANKSPTHQNRSMYEQRKSPIDQHRPSLSKKQAGEDHMRRSPDYTTKKKLTFERDDRDYSAHQRRSPDMFEPSSEAPKKIPKPRKEDESSVCEEIPLDPDVQRAKAEEKALRLGKETTAHAKANHAIDTIAEAQTMQYIEPAKKVRPVTAEAKVQHRPKPRYGTLPGAQSTQMLEQEFNSTSDIRDAIYEQWYAERLKLAKKKKKEEEKKKIEEEEKKKKEEQERLQEAQLSYKAWVEKKKETVFRDQARKRQKEAEKKNHEEQEKQEKQDEAMKTFKHWKEKKDAMIRYELQKKRQTEEEKQREKEEEEYIKRKDRETAFKGWKSKKEQDFIEQKRRYKEEKDNVRRKKEEEKELERRKEEEATRKYHDWMAEKEKQTRLEMKRQKQRILSEEDDFRPAWSPANRTIPFGR